MVLRIKFFIIRITKRIWDKKEALVAIIEGLIAKFNLKI